MPSIITLTTDFGVQDSFVAAMKGVLLTQCPNVTLIDVTHEIASGDIRTGALRLAAVTPYFPPATVHLAVVDPGVGSARRALAVESSGQYFVGPDNGLLSLATKPVGRAIEVTNRGLWLPHLSQTFHGRDIFAPAAAHLAAGRPFDDLGEEISNLVELNLPPVEREPGRLRGAVIDIDRFGNLATNIRRDDVGAADIKEVEAGGRRIRGISAWYDPGQALVAVFNGEGWLEIAAPGRSAAAEIGIGVDSPIIVVLVK
jgi:S-adenosyl-L-methionine hydrolase (adenosine-forming)